MLSLLQLEFCSIWESLIPLVQESMYSFKKSRVIKGNAYTPSQLIETLIVPKSHIKDAFL